MRGDTLTRLTIKDETTLSNIFKTISWLDDKRWNVEYNYNFVNFFKNDLSNCEKILTHWICYITDRQMPFEIVWDKGGYVFSELVYEYSRNTLSPQQPKQIFDKYYDKYKDNKDKERFRFKSTDNVYFASRYVTDDYEKISQTLEVLNKSEYKRNIVVYIIDIIRKFKDSEDLLVRVACGLHLLSYHLDRKKAIAEKVTRIINENEKFEKKLSEFKKTSTRGKKRLWCCIRDYKKGLYHQIFNSAINEVASENAEELIKKWDGLPMNQIELPGDVWNNSPLFRDNLFSNILDVDKIPKTWGMPDVVRELYNQIKKDKDAHDFYPEQFDITFDFVPRMCNKKLCRVCLFGRDGVESICIPTKDKYCPVALVSCGYIAKCMEAGCILKSGISKGICKGRVK
jgi:hypothetical protein